MRALNKGWIGIALVILFGASLFFFRGSSRYSNLFNSDNFVANISGTPVSTSQFLRSLEMNIGQFAQMIGEELSGDQIRAFQIHQLVLQNLINNAIFENEFDDLNYILDDSTIAKETKKRFPNLYINNKINDEALNNFLRQQRLKIEDLVNIVNYETRSVLFDSLIFEKNYPRQLASKIDMFENQTRNVELMSVSFKNIVVPDLNENNLTKDNLELIEYFNQNKSKYMSNEKRNISYLIIDKEKFKIDFVPSQNNISNYYDDNKEIYIIPEKRSFKQFNFKTKEEAENFKLNITNLSNSEIISYASDNKIKFNNFEDVSSNQVLEELSNVIFSLQNNEVSDVITSPLANHIIILDKITSKRQPSISEVNDKIKDVLTNVKLDNFFNDLKIKLNQQILNGYSINELANENNLFLENIETTQRVENENILINDIINKAFSLNKDFTSDIYDFDTNKSYIINVNEIYPSKVEELNKVFNDVLSDFIKSKKIIFSRETYEKYKNDNNLKKIKDIFKSNIEEINIKLSDNSLLPSVLVNNIFNIKLNEITFSSDENNVYFAKINKIQIPNNNEISPEINLKSELKNAFGNEIIKTKNISLNDELINGLLSQYK